MSEDAPVNTGAAGWPQPGAAYLAVRRMQTKLHRWATDDPGRCFGDLFNLVHDPAFLVHAWERVSNNKGAQTAGIDKATVAKVEALVGVEAFLGYIRDSLKAGGFRPVEVRQVRIPKGNTGKFRKLGIPTIADRVVQASLKLVLEPVFEADFQPCSYGFRPNRRAHDAIAEIHHLASSPGKYVPLDSTNKEESICAATWTPRRLTGATPNWVFRARSLAQPTALSTPGPADERKLHARISMHLLVSPIVGSARQLSVMRSCQARLTLNRHPVVKTRLNE